MLAQLLVTLAIFAVIFEVFCRLLFKWSPFTSVLRLFRGLN